MKDTVILGIDPGSIRSGYGIIKKRGNTLYHVENGIISPDKGVVFRERIAYIFKGVLDIIELYQPDIMGLEDIFISVNAKSALKLGHVKGVVMAAAVLKNIPLRELTPTKVKKAITGSGRASKAQIAMMVKTILQLPEPPQEDAADALAVAIARSFSL
ncbi:MAG: crossover junction endodeoxyribonuclease RuvC [bacterium]